MENKMFKWKTLECCAVKLPDDQGYAIEFANSLYVVKIDLLMDFSPGYGFFCATFKTQEVEEQTLFSNHDKDNPDYPANELLVSKSKISICGVKNEKPATVSIDHDCRDWTTPNFWENHCTELAISCQLTFKISW